MILNGYILSKRQGEIALLISEGKTEKQIANELGITPGTTKVYTSNLYRRIGLAPFTGKANRVKLARMVWESSNPVIGLQELALRASEEWSKLA